MLEYDRYTATVIENQIFILQARLWVQVLRDMRTGVKLKKVEFSKTPVEYEMTPYEILMDDIK